MHTPTRSSNTTASSMSSPILTSGIRCSHPDSQEGRLVSLVREYQLLHFNSDVEKLGELQRQYRRQGYASDSDIHHLTLAQRRSLAFLSNVETILTGASAAPTPLDPGTLRAAMRVITHVQDFVRDAGEFAAYVAARRRRHHVSSHSTAVTPDRPVARFGATGCTASARQPVADPVRPLSEVRLLHRNPRPTATSRNAASPSRPNGLSPALGTPERQRTDLGTSATSVSPASFEPRGSGVSSTLPLSGHRVASATHCSPRGALVSEGSGLHLSLAVRRELLERIEALAASADSLHGMLSDEEASSAKQCFSSLYGQADGNRRFLRWCDERAAVAVRSGACGHATLATSF